MHGIAVVVAGMMSFPPLTEQGETARERRNAPSLVLNPNLVKPCMASTSNQSGAAGQFLTQCFRIALADSPFSSSWL